MTTSDSPTDLTVHNKLRHYRAGLLAHAEILDDHSSRLRALDQAVASLDARLENLTTTPGTIVTDATIRAAAVALAAPSYQDPNIYWATLPAVTQERHIRTARAALEAAQAVLHHTQEATQ